MNWMAFLFAWVVVFVWLLLGALSYRVWPENTPWDKADLQVFALITGPLYLPARGTLWVAASIMAW